MKTKQTKAKRPYLTRQLMAIRVVLVLHCCLIMFLICVGPGLHLRHGWVAYVDGAVINPPTTTPRLNGTVASVPDSTSTNGSSSAQSLQSPAPSSNLTLLRLFCGEPAMTNYANEQCPFHADTQLPVWSLHGYTGFAHMNLWVPLHLYPQFGCLGIMGAVTVTAIALLMQACCCDVQRGPRCCLPMFLSLVMLCVCVAQAYLSFCTDYSRTYTQEYWQQIQQMTLNSTHRDTVQVSVESVVVECRVAAFEWASMLALLCSLTLLLDAITLRLIDRNRNRVLKREITGNKTSNLSRSAALSKSKSSKTASGSMEENETSTSKTVVPLGTGAMVSQQTPPDVQSETVDSSPAADSPTEQKLKEQKVHLEEIHNIADAHVHGKLDIPGGKSGQIWIHPVATIVKAPGDADARKARLSFGKDKTGMETDARRKEYVYGYINDFGGSVLDPAGRGQYLKVNPGEL